MPAIEILLLVALVLADPNHITTRARWLRRLGITLTFGLLVVTLVSTSVLIRDLIDGGKTINSADVLLASGALVWLGNVMVFSLLYWQLDCGGPLARYRGAAHLPRLPLPAAGEPRVRPARLAAQVPGLPGSRPDDEHRVQPDRRDADGAVVEAHHGAASAHRARRRRSCVARAVNLFA